MGEDAFCTYVPKGGAVIQPMRERKSPLIWTREAERRLARVPSFLRKMVGKRVEDYVREQGRRKVAADDIQTLARRRFGKGGPGPRRPGDIAKEIRHGR